MTHRLKIAAALSILIANNIVAATQKPEALLKAFDTQFQKAFFVKENILKEGVFKHGPLLQVMEDVRLAIDKDYSQFAQAYEAMILGVVTICGLPNDFLKTYKKGIEGRIAKGERDAFIMLTFTSWKMLKLDVENLLEKAKEQFAKAKKLLEKKKLIESSSTKAMRSLLQHIIKRFEGEALARIVQDFQNLRDTTKFAPYKNYEQLKVIADNIATILNQKVVIGKSQQVFDVNDERWARITNEVGLDKIAFFKEVWKKFEVAREHKFFEENASEKEIEKWTAINEILDKLKQAVKQG